MKPDLMEPGRWSDLWSDLVESGLVGSGLVGSGLMVRFGGVSDLVKRFGAIYGTYLQIMLCSIL